MRQPKSERSRDAAAASERVTTTLTARVTRELADLQEASGLSKTDLVNRAITLYAFVVDQADHGLDLALKHRATGEVQVIHII